MIVTIATLPRLVTELTRCPSRATYSYTGVSARGVALTAWSGACSQPSSERTSEPAHATRPTAATTLLRTTTAPTRMELTPLGPPTLLPPVPGSNGEARRRFAAGAEQVRKYGERFRQGATRAGVRHHGNGQIV